MKHSGFVWEDYLNENDLVPVDSSIFPHASLGRSHASPAAVQLGDLVEVETEDGSSCWPAFVTLVCGSLVRLRYVTGEDRPGAATTPEHTNTDSNNESVSAHIDSAPATDCAAADLWCDQRGARLHVRGWAAQQGMPLVPPLGLLLVAGRTPADLLTLLPEQDGRVAPTMATPGLDRIREGMKLELLDEAHPYHAWPATVLERVGTRLRVRPDTLQVQDADDLWLPASSTRLRYFGWATRAGAPFQYQPPQEVTGGRSSDEWAAILEMCRDEARLAAVDDDMMPPSELPLPPEHGLSVGCRLEAVHPDRTTICPASVVDLLDSRFFRVQIDGSDFSWVSSLDDATILPYGWCAEHGLDFSGDDVPFSPPGSPVSCDGAFPAEQASDMAADHATPGSEQVSQESTPTDAEFSTIGVHEVPIPGGTGATQTLQEGRTADVEKGSDDLTMGQRGIAEIRGDGGLSEVFDGKRDEPTAAEHTAELHVEGSSTIGWLNEKATLVNDDDDMKEDISLTQPSDDDDSSEQNLRLSRDQFGVENSLASELDTEWNLTENVTEGQELLAVGDISTDIPFGCETVTVDNQTSPLDNQASPLETDTFTGERAVLTSPFPAKPEHESRDGNSLQSDEKARGEDSEWSAALAESGEEPLDLQTGLLPQESEVLSHGLRFGTEQTSALPDPGVDLMQPQEPDPLYQVSVCVTQQAATVPCPDVDLVGGTIIPAAELDNQGEPVPDPSELAVAGEDVATDTAGGDTSTIVSPQPRDDFPHNNDMLDDHDVGASDADNPREFAVASSSCSETRRVCIAADGVLEVGVGTRSPLADLALPSEQRSQLPAGADSAVRLGECNVADNRDKGRNGPCAREIPDISCPEQFEAEATDPWGRPGGSESVQPGEHVKRAEASTGAVEAVMKPATVVEMNETPALGVNAALSGALEMALKPGNSAVDATFPNTADMNMAFSSAPPMDVNVIEMGVMTTRIPEVTAGSAVHTTPANATGMHVTGAITPDVDMMLSSAAGVALASEDTSSTDVAPGRSVDVPAKPGESDRMDVTHADAAEVSVIPADAAEMSVTSADAAGMSVTSANAAEMSVTYTDASEVSVRHTGALEADAIHADIASTDAIEADITPTGVTERDVTPTDAMESDVTPTDAMEADVVPTDAIEADITPADAPEIALTHTDATVMDAVHADATGMDVTHFNLRNASEVPTDAAESVTHVHAREESLTPTGERGMSVTHTDATEINESSAVPAEAGATSLNPADAIEMSAILANAAGVDATEVHNSPKSASDVSSCGANASASPLPPHPSQLRADQLPAREPAELTGLGASTALEVVHPLCVDQLPAREPAELMGLGTSTALEVVHPQCAGQLCAAVVRRTAGHLVWINLLPMPGTPDLIYPSSSDSLFPVGWADRHGATLLPPTGWPPKQAPPATHRDVDSDVESEADSVALNQAADSGSLSEPVGASLRSPVLYLYPSCRCGPLLSANRLCNLAPTVGPAPVRTVARTLLVRLISAAHRAGLAVRHLTDVRAAPAAASTTGSASTADLLKIRAGGALHTLALRLPSRRSQLAEFCADVCERLRCCPGLVSQQRRPPGAICPHHCCRFIRSSDLGSARRPAAAENGADRAAFDRRGQRAQLRARTASPPAKRPRTEHNKHANAENQPPSSRLRARPLGRDCEEEDQKVPAVEVDSEEEDDEQGDEVPVNGGADIGEEASTPALYQISVEKNPRLWEPSDLENYLHHTECAHLADILKQQEMDGVSFMLVTRSALMAVLGLSRRDALALCTHAARLKYTYFSAFSGTTSVGPMAAQQHSSKSNVG